jgi:ubiquinone/menaquinone biosynthesis C-methylase UbiE
MQKGADWWDNQYRKEEHLRRWDYRYPSPELVSVVVAGLVPSGGATLDIGCGAGREAIFLAQCGFRSIGLDWSEEALSLARQRARESHVEVDWRQGSVLELPLSDRSVDFAADRGCFHHIQEEDRARYAYQIARVLKPGGHLLLRGCRCTADDDPGDAAFLALSEENIDRAFGLPTFSHGRVLPVRLVSDAGTLDANMVLIERR